MNIDKTDDDFDVLMTSLMFLFNTYAFQVMEMVIKVMMMIRLISMMRTAMEVFSCSFEDKNGLPRGPQFCYCLIYKWDVGSCYYRD